MWLAAKDHLKINDGEVKGAPLRKCVGLATTQSKISRAYGSIIKLAKIRSFQDRNGSPNLPGATKPKEPGLPLRVLGERCRRLERKPRVRPLVSRREEEGHSGIRERMKPQYCQAKTASYFTKKKAERGEGLFCNYLFK